MSEITRTMTVEEVRETLGCEYVPTGRALWLARTALEWLAERDALAERIGLLQVERDTVWNQADTFRAERDAVTVERDEVRNDLSKSRAFARGLSANIVAAEEARDLAITERDEAYRQRDAAEVRALVKAMGAAEAEPPQVFRPHFEVMIGPDCADRPCATLRLVQPIRDPAFMALTADQLSRLGLVVCDE